MSEGIKVTLSVKEYVSNIGQITTLAEEFYGKPLAAQMEVLDEDTVNFEFPDTPKSNGFLKAMEGRLRSNMEDPEGLPPPAGPDYEV